MKHIIAILLLPIRVIILFLQMVYEVIESLATSVSEGISNILDENYDFWEKIWLKIIKTILHKK